MAAAMAMVGALRTKMLEMLVPSRMREVCDGAGGEHGELVPAMALGDPGAVVPEILGELHALDDLGRE